MKRSRPVPLIGRKVGKLQVLAIVAARTEGRKDVRPVVSCRCECGAPVERGWNSLASAAAQGKTPACEACTSRLRREQMPEINRRRWHGEPETA